VIEIRQTIAARVARQAIAIQPQGEMRLDTVKKLQERYRFGKVPQTIEELFPTDPAAGIKFEHGTLIRDDGRAPVIVDFLQLLPNNIILVQTRVSTDDAEEFLNDYIANANRERSETIQVFGASFYASEIEFSWTKSLDEYAVAFRTAARQLELLVAGYGSPDSHYRTASIVLNLDPSKVAGVSPAHFNVERRAGVPDNLNLYYSHAPLKTRDHLDLLKSLDNA
jgi:hypothetical protein